VSLDVYLEPAKEVGGDLVDHFRIDDDLLAFLVGDVSDKGAGAALMMARTHSMFRSLAVRPDAREIFSDPSKAMSIVNAALAAGNSSCMFVTMFLGTLSLSTLQLTFVRAGHVPPYQWNGTAAIKRLDAAGGPPLGLVEDFQYKQHTSILSPDESLLVLTDGFTEANDPGGLLFGDERITSFLIDAGRVHEGTLPSLVRIVHAFEAGQPQSDDMAAILLSFRPLVAP
jgi:sigma-B regulation protein RsbU (phosphoserine phosphatase)